MAASTPNSVLCGHICALHQMVDEMLVKLNGNFFLLNAVHQQFFAWEKSLVKSTSGEKHR
jgi:hypothetical protein